jgi:hypothetical protein
MQTYSQAPTEVGCTELEIEQAARLVHSSRRIRLRGNGE